MPEENRQRSLCDGVGESRENARRDDVCEKSQPYGTADYEW